MENKHFDVAKYFQDKLNAANVQNASDIIQDTIRGSSRLYNAADNQSTATYLCFANNQAAFAPLGSNIAQLVTNQTSNGGQLSAGEDFIVQQIKFSILFPQFSKEVQYGNPNIVSTIFTNAVCEFKVSNKTVWQGILATVREPNQRFTLDGFAVPGQAASGYTRTDSTTIPSISPVTYQAQAYILNSSVKIDLRSQAIALKSQVAFDMSINTGKIDAATVDLSVTQAFICCELIGLRRRAVS